MKSRRPLFTALTLLGLLAVAPLAGCAADPHRYFQPTADQIGPHLNSYGEAVIPLHGLIVVQGDEMAYGLARGRSRHLINGAAEGQASLTISEALRKVVKGVRVENRGYPGDTAAQSQARWADQARPDLLILAFGYGDMRAHTPTTAFLESLRPMVRDAQAQGTAVFILEPPTLKNPLRDAALDPYRLVARNLAERSGALSFDGRRAVDRIKAPIAADAAQTPAVYQAMAADMIAYIKVVAPSPQTGQAGSGDSRTVRVSAASAS